MFHRGKRLRFPSTTLCSSCHRSIRSATDSLGLCVGTAHHLPTLNLELAQTGLCRYSEVKADIKESEFDGFTWTEVRLPREPPHKPGWLLSSPDSCCHSRALIRIRPRRREIRCFLEAEGISGMSFKH